MGLDISPASPRTLNQPQSSTPLHEGGKPGKTEGSTASNGIVDASSTSNVKVESKQLSFSGTSVKTSGDSITDQPDLSSGHHEISASTQRLVDMSIAETKDGPAGSYLGRVLIENAAVQRNQNMQDMIADRQKAYSLTMAAADQDHKAGEDLEKAADAGLVMGMTGAACSFAHASTGKSKSGSEEETPDLATALKAATQKEKPSRLAAAGDAFGKGSSYADTHGQAVSKEDESEGKIDDAMAEQANMAADRKKDALDKLDELTKQVIEFIHDFQETNNDMMAAITRG